MHDPMNADRTFTFHEDPGHGWLAVPVSILRALNIADKISRYSYRTEHTAYLEEDCDAAVFWNAWTARHGTAPNIRRSYKERSHVRRLPSYTI